MLWDGVVGGFYGLINRYWVVISTFTSERDAQQSNFIFVFLMFFPRLCMFLLFLFCSRRDSRRIYRYLRSEVKVQNLSSTRLFSEIERPFYRCYIFSLFLLLSPHHLSFFSICEFLSIFYAFISCSLGEKELARSGSTDEQLWTRWNKKKYEIFREISFPRKCVGIFTSKKDENENNVEF